MKFSGVTISHFPIDFCTGFTTAALLRCLWSLVLLWALVVNHPFTQVACRIWACDRHQCVLVCNRLQASSYELHVNENDTASETAQLILYSNIPITCQLINAWNDRLFCYIKFSIRSDTTDIAMRMRHPTSILSDDKGCLYQLDEADWKPNEGFAYSSSKQLQFIAKVPTACCGLRSYALISG